jgi:hypothetical protein
MSGVASMRVRSAGPALSAELPDPLTTVELFGFPFLSRLPSSSNAFRAAAGR